MLPLLWSNAKKKKKNVGDWLPPSQRPIRNLANSLIVLCGMVTREGSMGNFCFRIALALSEQSSFSGAKTTELPLP